MPAPDETSVPQTPGGPPTPANPVPAGQPPHPPYAQPAGSGEFPGYPATPGASDVPPAFAEANAQRPSVGGGIAPTRKSGFAWLWWLVGIAVVMIIIASIASLIAAIGGGAGGGIVRGGNVIAVIPFDGTIAGTGAGPNVITPETFLRQLERAEDDPSVKAIVLRVNSPGGTVAASEEIATYVNEATKPVVVSVGDVDASGAYMVSSQADKIVAGPGSAVGSIGVIMEVPNASGLLDKIGVKFKVLTAGKYKDAGTPFRDLTPTEVSMLQGQIDQVYGQFIDIVASGRNLPRSEVESMATGWAWNGQEAKGMRLVDEIGTYKTALKTAAKLGGIEGEYKEDVYSNAETLNSLLSSLLGIESQLKAIAANSPVGPTSVGAPRLAK
jgi:protease IV